MHFGNVRETTTNPSGWVHFDRILQCALEYTNNYSIYGNDTFRMQRGGPISYLLVYD